MTIVTVIFWLNDITSKITIISMTMQRDVLYCTQLQNIYLWTKQTTILLNLLHSSTAELIPDISARLPKLLKEMGSPISTRSVVL